MNDMLRQKLADLKAQQASGEHMVCPRCGLDRMKPELYTNALSREADEAEIMVCDQCGTEEAMLAFMRNPKPLTSWACFQPERPAGDFKAVCGAEAWEEIRNTQLPFLSQLYERWQDERGLEDFEAYRLAALQKCKGLMEIWEQPFHVRYEVQDGDLILRFRDTGHGVEVAWDVVGKKS